MMWALIADWLRPGFVLFSGVVFFMCTGVLSPREALAGFANEGMITVGLLFLISEGVRRSDALGHLVKWLLPSERGITVRKGYLRILPTIASVSAFLNNTPVVVVFIPIIKQWARKSGLAVRKFLIPLSYAAMLGGMCTLIGTSTNLVVHGMMLDAGFEGFTMFELGKVGGCIALVGGLYLIFFGDKRLPGDTPNEETVRNEEPSRLVEAVLGPRFPGINRPFGEFDFKSHYGAEIRAVRRNGVEIEELDKAVFRAGDTLVLDTDGSFIETWGESRVFLMLSNGSEHRPACPRWKKCLALGLLVIMIAGATFGRDRGGGVGGFVCVSVPACTWPSGSLPAVSAWPRLACAAWRMAWPLRTMRCAGPMRPYVATVMEPSPHRKRPSVAGVKVTA